MGRSEIIYCRPDESAGDPRVTAFPDNCHCSSYRPDKRVRRRLKRLLLVPFLLHGPGQSLYRFPVSPPPCSRGSDGIIRVFFCLQYPIANFNNLPFPV